MSCSLTMWDVNDEEMNELLALEKLFFNYVGCKSKYNLFFKRFHCCCSLTMWDVNLDKAGIILNFYDSCSLTMWDVNLSSAFSVS